jgi:hypothetical protein
VPVHVREMPFSNKKRKESILSVEVEIFAYEPVVWVSLTRAEITILPENAPKFLAIVDTGNTVAFNIQEDHLTAWAQLKAVDLPFAGPLGKVSDASGRIAKLARRQARIWLHPYPEGTGLAPRDLQVVGGILVYESPQAGHLPLTIPQLIGPHLPLLGARAFFPTNLGVSVNYRRLHVTIGDDDQPT